MQVDGVSLGTERIPEESSPRRQESKEQLEPLSRVYKIFFSENLAMMNQPQHFSLLALPLKFQIPRESLNDLAFILNIGLEKGETAFSTVPNIAHKRGEIMSH